MEAPIFMQQAMDFVADDLFEAQDRLDRSIQWLAYTIEKDLFKGTPPHTIAVLQCLRNLESNYCTMVYSFVLTCALANRIIIDTTAGGRKEDAGRQIDTFIDMISRFCAPCTPFFIMGAVYDEGFPKELKRVLVDTTQYKVSPCPNAVHATTDQGLRYACSRRLEATMSICSVRA